MTVLILRTREGFPVDDSKQDVGYSIWSLLNHNVADIHFEKAAHSVKGAPQYLTQQCAELLAKSNIKYMNREQDLGSEGIRRAPNSLAQALQYRRFFAAAKKL